MLVWVPGRTDALRVFIHTEAREAKHHAAEIGGSVIPAPLFAADRLHRRPRRPPPTCAGMADISDMRRALIVVDIGRGGAAVNIRQRIGQLQRPADAREQHRHERQCRLPKLLQRRHERGRSTNRFAQHPNADNCQL